MKRRKFFELMAATGALMTPWASKSLCAASTYGKIQRVRTPSRPQGMEIFHQIFIELPKEVAKGDERAIRVVIGPPHPMKQEHHIMWLEIFVDDVLATRLDFTPELSIPAIEIPINVSNGRRLRVLHMCNKHGMWEKTINI